MSSLKPSWLSTLLGFEDGSVRLLGVKEIRHEVVLHAAITGFERTARGM